MVVSDISVLDGRRGSLGGSSDVGEDHDDDEGKQRMKVSDALPRMEEEELDERLAMLDVDMAAVEATEERGIIFVDEIDKLVRGGGRSAEGAAASFSKGEGVQKELLALLETRSAYTDGFVEGVYLRIDDAAHCVARGKCVRPDFIQGIEEHWMAGGLVKNAVALGGADEEV